MKKITSFSLFLLLMLILPIQSWAEEYIRGIYITQPMMESTKKITKIIERAKQVGINTFIVDIEWKSKIFEKNIQLLSENNIHYVARLVVFPHGGVESQITSETYWQKRYELAAYAVKNGAETIQLDYIRYDTNQGNNPNHAKNILKVIQYFRENLNKTNTKLQLALFGETSFGPSVHIGQDVKEFYSSIDSIAPMVYPSHYFPYAFHSQRPYETIYDSLTAMQGQFNNELPFQLYPYIEMYNVRYNIPAGQSRINYIFKQIKAVQDSNANGWYAWSAKNRYEYLFQTLEQYKSQLN